MCCKSLDMQGTPAALIIAGILSLAFMGFVGLIIILFMILYG